MSVFIVINSEESISPPFISLAIFPKPTGCRKTKEIIMKRSTITLEEKISAQKIIRKRMLYKRYQLYKIILFFFIRNLWILTKKREDSLRETPHPTKLKGSFPIVEYYGKTITTEEFHEMWVVNSYKNLESRRGRLIFKCIKIHFQPNVSKESSNRTIPEKFSSIREPPPSKNFSQPRINLLRQTAKES